MANYINRKHNLTSAKLHHVHLNSLGHCLRKLKPPQRATMVKLIHGWIPTNNVLHKQGRQQTHLCPRCQIYKETTDHILHCPDSDAHDNRQDILYKSLNALKDAHTSIYILQAFEQKLTKYLQINSRNMFNPPNINNMTPDRAIKHQNIVGWDNFCRGYISKLWTSTQQEQYTSNKHHSKWAEKLTSTILNMHYEIWKDRNTYVHGKTIQEAKEKARCAIVKMIKELYKKPPTLAKRYCPIYAVPLTERLKRPTGYLQDWIHRIAHQVRMTELINCSRPPGQLTIKEAFANAVRRRRSSHAYPP